MTLMSDATKAKLSMYGRDLLITKQTLDDSSKGAPRRRLPLGKPARTSTRISYPGFSSAPAGSRSNRNGRGCRCGICGTTRVCVTPQSAECGQTRRIP